MEVCIGRVWGTVCDPWYFDFGDHYGWSSGYARVVCRQLRFEVDQGTGAFSDSKPTQSSYFDVNC